MLDVRNILLGTDWWDDCDDVVAVRLIARAVKSRDVRLLGVAVNACMEYSVASIKGFLCAEGIDGVPIGIDLEADDFGGAPPYQKRLAETYCPHVRNTDAEDAVRLYRKILAASKEKVEIIEIGFLQAVAGLLKSGADDISEKSGMELVSEKVSKFWVMAGRWSVDGGWENNFCRNPRSRAGGSAFCELCPVPVTFLGFEIGLDVISGAFLDRNDPLHLALADHGSPNGRHSWDPMLVLMALIGDEERAGYETVKGRAYLDPATGANHFEKNSEGKHKFVIKKYPNQYYEEQINARIGS